MMKYSKNKNILKLAREVVILLHPQIVASQVLWKENLNQSNSNSLNS